MVLELLQIVGLVCGVLGAVLVTGRTGQVRAARSKDPDTVLLRQHRQAHRWNITHEELIEKRAVPKGDFRAQARLSDYDEAAARRRHADKLIADCERLQADHDARVERWRKMGWC